MKKMMIALIAMCMLVSCSVMAQFNYQTESSADTIHYTADFNPYTVEALEEPDDGGAPQNVILMIGDGMGVSHIFSALTANRGVLYMSSITNIGFQNTYSLTNYITDSAAAGTALSTGKKTYTGAIGVDENKKPIENIREKFEKRGMATGVVSTSSVTHATPAAFVAHNEHRNNYEEIAADFLKTDIDVFIGGGYDNFAKREDGKNLIEELENKGYKVETTIDEVSKVTQGKLAGLIAPGHTAQASERQAGTLEIATQTAIDILDNNEKGFFLMVEGSQIDWAGHNNHTGYLVRETIDFDRAVGEALRYAATHKNTLVIVTADHETGGFAVNNGNMEKGKVQGAFTSTNHTPLMVPVMAYGSGSIIFRGFYDNTDIPKKIMSLFE